MPFETPSVQGGRQRNFFLILCMAPMENSNDSCGCHDPPSQSYCPPQILDPPASPGPPSPAPFLPQKPRGGIPGSEGRGRRGPGEGALEGWGWGSWDQRPPLRQGAARVPSPLTLLRVRPGPTERTHSFPAWKILPKPRGFSRRNLCFALPWVHGARWSMGSGRLCLLPRVPAFCEAERVAPG